MRLVVIGITGGFFSALFGVGGGIVIVPLLILLAALGEREAMATSLAAVLLTVAVGVAAYGALGEVHPREAALVGLPGMAGALAGAALQQRVPRHRLGLLFALLLVAVSVTLLVR